MSRKTATNPDPDKLLSRRVLVLINRDQTAKSPRVVWHHEVPVLEAIHGEGNLTIQESDVLDEGYSNRPNPELMPFNKQQDTIQPPSATMGLGWVFIGDPRTEFTRMCDVYGKHPEVNEAMAENVYGRFQDGRFSRLLGRPELADLPEDQLRSLCQSYGASAEQIAKASNLIALAEELGVRLY